MKHLSSILIITAAVFAGCKKDVDPIIPPTAGAEVQLNGIAVAEPGSAAGNAVYLDFASSQQKAVLRSSWDLGFYCGADFRVILNSTAVAGAKVLNTNDINAVGAADTVGLALTTSQTNPLPEHLAFFDDINGDITKTAIPAVAATDADNKVVIINRGTGGGIAARPWMKIRVLRNSNGYTLQYARITETSFKTLLIPKNEVYHFRNISFDNGIVDNQPEKDKWDIMWSYGLYQANFGAGLVPYNFSDMISVNHLAGVTVAQKVYPDAATALAAYNNFNTDSVSKTTLVAGKWTIASSWRSTQPATGARQDRFYIIKDIAGNYYKLKCLDMGIADGGFRGKPKFRYALIK
jgi:HmuY protein